MSADAGTKPAITKRDLHLASPGSSEARGDAAAPGIPQWLRRFLGVPLLWKLAGANALVVGTAIGAGIAANAHATEPVGWLVPTLLALGVSFALNMALVWLALRPVAALEATAEQVTRGERQARVPASIFADRQMARTNNTFNRLLDDLMAERARMRRLASQVISLGEDERLRIARELHDTTAQHLAALMYQLSALVRDVHDLELAERIEVARGLAADVMDEVRALAYSVHPRVLEDLGLPAALGQLGRQVTERYGVDTDVDTDEADEVVPKEMARVLYRVAQEAVGSALRNGSPTHVGIRLASDPEEVTLEISEDGDGLEPPPPDSIEGDGAALGLFSIRERLALVNGRCEVATARGHGTRITARIPLTA